MSAKHITDYMFPIADSEESLIESNDNNYEVSTRMSKDDDRIEFQNRMKRNDNINKLDE